MKKEDGSPNYNKSKHMTYSIVKSKTILDLKNKIKIKTSRWDIFTNNQSRWHNID